MKTAVILFVFNRPLHTSKVLAGLKKNSVEKLYVFCDGPRNSIDFEKVEEVKELVNSINWCHVELTAHNKNKGLAQSVIDGITEVVNLGYDSVIVLEDDCVPKEGFINYMKNALNFYENDDEVMHVSGFGLPINKHTKADTYFTPYPCSWGWGTWAKYWNNCDFNNTQRYKNLLADKRMIEKFNYSGEAFSEFLQMQLDGHVNSWLIRWYFYIFENSGRCVWRYESLIENKGFDGSGVHKNKLDRFNQKAKNTVLSNSNYKFEVNKTYNKGLIKEFRRHFMGKKLIEKIKTTIYLITGKIVGK
ncbi:glycosyltransferase family 2 protein [Rossellomorea sp. NPDC071047]|uniref:glycosyltransferase family 2 protein n=1 Tax=Rossellomorea sp. NPDC071047 TaxID=3390675 RepID=UPI003D02AF4F